MKAEQKRLLKRAIRLIMEGDAERALVLLRRLVSE